MAQDLPIVCVARHGETEWSRIGRHTGLKDLPLTERGEFEARQLGSRLRKWTFGCVLTSPLRRASTTCDLAGFGGRAESDRDLVEWDYGDYQGLRADEIRRERPDWDLFRDGCPNGETPQQVGARADRVLSKLLARLRDPGGNVLVFSSGHFLRVLASRWLGLEPAAGRWFHLGTASLSAFGFESGRDQRMLRWWNETAHLDD